MSGLRRGHHSLVCGLLCIAGIAPVYSTVSVFLLLVMSTRTASAQVAAGWDQGPPLSQSDEAEARRHYKAGVVALENNDLSVAADEFREALKFAPSKALVHYNLAIVLSKQNNPADGLTSVKKAIQLGLPEKEADEAEDLEASSPTHLSVARALTLVGWPEFGPRKQASNRAVEVTVI
jgi:tetratricopeptide (TPR) repeat protein